MFDLYFHLQITFVNVMKKIGTLLFDDVELLDFAGPLQVFSSLGPVLKDDTIVTPIIGITKDIYVSKSKLKVTCDHVADDFDEQLDLLIIPGGMGTRAIVKDEKTLASVTKLIGRSKKVASVCTGSLVLAKLGYLSNKKATTHFAALDIMSKLDPSIIIDRSKRYHDHEDIIVSEGVSAGIDMSLYLVGKHVNKETADLIRKYIEYYPEPV